MLASLLIQQTHLRADDYKGMRHMFTKLQKWPAQAAELGEMQEYPE